ncbi:nitrite reductase, copper-containing [Candidatus Kaiserbacteria bacterium RIFCSPLOWO2_02_FULL_45_11b]|uniref:Copper-containing nitrite reductase n=1 Tax=Candidatus Kaiserbacteria bacterium RIFCSPLOWO2_12_FULL_45_26 TaxID=1798525 RepID=A0A1F6FGU4_9BACT|nr:MAG: nitrite reductase, copper-containing [Candidatus Kaiserbacteria bacterium RIFCSPHIGHO2_12_45_16]OGG69679.1 MAG: nitrite reductase, copper-containing [Candidatus Kaiserbacteria bacterium RIFCSPLOWO2_01_FULL_45_25]OGG81482.1 MAG: nitrite reductase, copper-containing [Candidatus Kaiserbacteria bacterium RIFCSPLOWO2_02_FULL_45_11b]OGG85071.1 MAG: nitrite reductase, copper-containing [Candidatus Kaiserbacteria bacterium RIFCSPLOWO2_12_FULL_45_26]
MIEHDFHNIEKLSWALVIMFIVGVVIISGGVLFLGGVELFQFLKVSLIQALGLGMAITAMLFFALRLVWRLKAAPMGISMIFFAIGISLFVSVSVGRLYALQYPVYVESFGPGSGPGLPMKNVISFFQHIDQFAHIEDIARDPSDVPPPITVLDPTPVTATLLSEMSASGTLAVVDEDAAPEEGGQIRELHLETTEVLSELAPGITFNYWTFNNTVPGPLFRVREGDIVRVTITNNASSLHHHNVDFHAATGPGGGGAVTMVAPGETKTFTFKALNPGLFVYHCATPNMAVHMAHGMYGMILVEPKDGLPAVDKEFYVMQGEIFTTGAIGRRGLQAFDAKKMMLGNPTYITFNGRPDGVVNKMKAEVGDKIRMYVGNGGVVHNSSFHVVGEIFDTVYPEASIGGAEFKNVQTTNVPAGGATIVEFTVDYPGTYVLVDHALMRTDKGAWGTIEVTGPADPTIYEGDFTKTSGSGH